MTPPSMRKSLPVMNAPSGPMRRAPTVPTSSGVPARPAGAQLDHAPVSLAARTGQLVLGEGRDDDAGADRVDPRAALAPPHRLGHHPQRVPALGELVGVERVRHLVRLEHRKSEQLVGGRGRQRLVLLGRQRREAVPRLRGDDDARSAARDDVAELLEHERGAIQIDLQDGGRRCLGGGDAGGMDDAGDVAERRGCLDERVDRLARGDVDDGGAHLEPGVARTLAAASAFSWRRSASRTCLPALTRRAIA